jgi:chemotaxis protein methyltransferase CheR
MQSDDTILAEIAATISKITGVQLGERQQSLVSSRIRRHMRELGHDSLQSYYAYYLQNSESEIQNLISLLTTHHTFFFREFAHFEYLLDKLPSIIAHLKSQGRNRIKLWCAASSKGHEVYSLAMFFEFHLKQIDPNMSYEILGSDVDAKSVAYGQNGVFPWDELQKTPTHYMANHWKRGKGEIAQFAKASSDLRMNLRWKTINLLDFKKEIASETFDIIFCRNVFIYFTPQQIEAISQNFEKILNPGALLFIGISENLTDLKLRLKHQGGSVYQWMPETAAPAKPALPIASKPSPTPTLRSAPSPVKQSIPPVAVSAPIRMLNVDDSASVLLVLKKIFAEEHGFKIVGTAKNGLEAKAFLDQNPGLVDMISLDIHMPEQNGLEFLAHSYKKNQHPPVIIVSSVSRDDKEVALKAFELGIHDYVEKPTLQELESKGEEMRTKFRFVHKMNSMGLVPKTTDTITAEFSSSPFIRDTHGTLRVITCSSSQLLKLKYILNHLRAPQPPTLVFIDAQENLTQSFKDILKKVEPSAELRNGLQLTDFIQGPVNANTVYIAHISQLAGVGSDLRMRKTNFMVLGEISPKIYKDIQSWSKAYIIAEDLGPGISKEYDLLCSASDMLVPYTSFAYESEKYLAS